MKATAFIHGMRFHLFVYFLTIAAYLVSCTATTTQTVDFERGLNNLQPGRSLSEFQKSLGTPDEINDRRKEEGSTIYVNYYRQGISLSVSNDTVQTIFYYFVSKKFDPFGGTIEHGINNSTAHDDIEKKLGKPDLDIYSFAVW